MAARGRGVDRRWLKRIGRPVLWERSSLLTNRRYDGATPFFEGNPVDRGYKYEQGRRISALLTSDNRKKEFDLAGAIESGRAMMTFDAALEIGPQDRVTFLDMSIRQEIELERGVGTQDLFASHPRVVGLQMVRGGAIDPFVEGQHYRLIRAEGIVAGIEWVTGANQPLSGQKYLIHAAVQPSWIVSDQPMVRGFAQDQLPGRAILLRDDSRVRIQ